MNLVVYLQRYKRLELLNRFYLTLWCVGCQTVIF